MFKLVWLQAVMASLGALCGALVAGGVGALSAALGGIACLLPTLWFAMFLRRISVQAEGARAVSFIVGEAVKIALVLGLLGLAPVLYPGLSWTALLIGLALTVQANFLVFRVKP